MKRSIGIYPFDFRLTKAALTLLDPEGGKRTIASCIDCRPDGRGGEEVEIRWRDLEQIMPSSSERLRLELAQSLLDSTPVVLNGVQNLEGGYYDLVVKAFEAARPEQIDWDEYLPKRT